MIPGTEGAWDPAFSPAGDWIVYSDRGGAGLMKVSLSGGLPTPVAGSGGQIVRVPHWGDDGTIVFAGPGGIGRVADTGGEPEVLTVTGFRNPSILPGGAGVLGAQPGIGVVLYDLGADSTRLLVPDGIDPKYVETGHLLYADLSGSLWAVAFDARRGEVLGSAVPVLDGLTVVEGMRARYSVSRNGTLVYGVGGEGGGGVLGQQRLLVLGLDASEDPAPLEPRNFMRARWSPDGESVVYHGSEPGASRGEPDIYTYNVELRTAPRLLTFEGLNIWPVWSPDGTQVAFASVRGGTSAFDVFVKAFGDDSPPRRIVSAPGDQRPTQWPSDGVLVFENGEPTDLWMVDPSSDDAVAIPYLESEADLDDPMVSPDGSLAAYTSNESVGDQIYVRSFPVARQPEVVSEGGGVFPFWSPDGNTVYYWTPGPNNGTALRTLIAARIDRGPPFAVIRRDNVLTGRYRIEDSDLHPDGDRLVIVQDVAASGADPTAREGPEPERFIVVVNWFEELRARMGED